MKGHAVLGMCCTITISACAATPIAPRAPVEVTVPAAPDVPAAPWGTVNEVYEGELSSDDAVHPADHSFRDTFPLETAQGFRCRVQMSSADFDTYLVVQTEEGVVLTQNDDADGTNSALAVVIPTDGIYEVIATSYGSSETGHYRLVIRCAPVDSESSCSDDCESALDGICDDGGPDAVRAHCLSGTDCSDCGPRPLGQ